MQRIFERMSEADLWGGGGGGGAPIPRSFCSHFEELRTMLSEVELIINDASLIYVYPNTIETFLTPSYLFWQTAIIIF